MDSDQWHSAAAVASTMTLLLDEKHDFSSSANISIGLWFYPRFVFKEQQWTSFGSG